MFVSRTGGAPSSHTLHDCCPRSFIVRGKPPCVRHCTRSASALPLLFIPPSPRLCTPPLHPAFAPHLCAPPLRPTFAPHLCAPPLRPTFAHRLNPAFTPSFTPALHIWPPIAPVRGLILGKQPHLGWMAGPVVPWPRVSWSRGLVVSWSRGFMVAWPFGHVAPGSMARWSCSPVPIALRSHGPVASGPAGASPFRSAGVHGIHG